MVAGRLDLAALALRSVGYLVELLGGGQKDRHDAYSYAECDQTALRRYEGNQQQGMVDLEVFWIEGDGDFAWAL